MGQPWAAVALEASRVPSLWICSGRNRGGKSTLGLLPRKFGEGGVLSWYLPVRPGGLEPIEVSPGWVREGGSSMEPIRVLPEWVRWGGAPPGTSRRNPRVAPGISVENRISPKLSYQSASTALARGGR